MQDTPKDKFTILLQDIETLGALQSCIWAFVFEIAKRSRKLQMPVSFESVDDMIIDLVDVCNVLFINYINESSAAVVF